MVLDRRESSLEHLDTWMREHQRSYWKAHAVERRRIFMASGEERAAGGGTDEKPKLVQAPARPPVLLHAILYLIVLSATTITSHAGP